MITIKVNGDDNKNCHTQKKIPEKKKMNYQTFKQKQEKEANEYTQNKLFFAFATTKEEVLNKLKNEYNLKPDEIIGLGYGAYTKKEYYHDLMKFFDKQAEELKKYTLNNIHDVLTTEFANYELAISMSYTYKNFLTDVLLFTEDELDYYKNEINLAIKDYREDFEKCNM